MTFNKTGSFWWQASYSGDVNNTSAKSPCTEEPLTVSPKHPTIDTVLVPASPITVGASIHDTSSLTGATPDAGGTVSYAIYTNNTCTTLATVAGDGISGQPTGGSVTAGAPANSSAVTFNKAGSFWWQASYSGDNNNVSAKSPCTEEPLTVNPKHPTIDTVLVPASPITVGGLTHDTSSLTGATPDAGGTVSYAIYTDNTCSTLATVAGDGISGQPTGGSVTAGAPANSSTVTFNKAGNFWWQATYSGDNNNVGPVKSPCTEEPLTVAPNVPAIHTLLSGSSVTVGATVHDTSSLTGATANAGGTVSYAVYTNNTCTTLATGGDGISGQPNGGSVISGIPATSSDVTFNKAGSFWWQATYSGDVNNTGPVKSTCTEEPLTVNPKNPSINTVLQPSSAVEVGSTVHDTSSLTGATPDAGGTVSYAVYTNNTCTTLAAAGDGISGQPTGGSVSGGNPASSSNVTFSKPGSFWWQATYSGDVNNVGPVKSTCTEEPLAVVDANIAITPLAPTNEVGHAHTFTVTVMKNNGSGFVPAAGVTVTATATANDGATITSAGGSTPLCVSGSPATATTDANGQCTITVNSSTGGQITVHAGTTFSVAGVSLTRATGDGKTGDSANGVKTYVDANIAITPLTPTNEVGVPHTFTVTVMKNDGSGGFAPAAGVTVAATATASNGATITSAGGSSPLCVSGSPATPTTDANGQCTITVSSSTGGKITVNATTTFSVGGVSLTRSTGDAKTGDSANGVKTYVDANIAITPLTATNEVGKPHTFTVTVMKNDGSGGFVPAAGVKVTATATASDGATITSAGGSHPQCLSGSPATETTDANGQCTITVNSSTGGQIDVNAATTLHGRGRQPHPDHG